MKMKAINTIILAAMGLAANNAMAACADVDRAALLTAATNAVAAEGSGFDLPMWVTMVDETGVVCYVVNTATTAAGAGAGGADVGNKSWLGSRVISAQKANTANAFSLDGYAISTANLYGLTQPGGSLYGLQHSNPVESVSAYKGNAKTFGTAKDPLVKKRIGGVNVFGGGLALYVDDNGATAGGIRKIGAIGVSGDTSCTDHAVAWRIRAALQLDKVPNGFHKANVNAAYTAIGDEMMIAASAAATATANTTMQPTCAFAPSESASNGVILE